MLKKEMGNIDGERLNGKGFNGKMVLVILATLMSMLVMGAAYAVENPDSGGSGITSVTTSSVSTTTTLMKFRSIPSKITIPQGKMNMMGCSGIMGKCCKRGLGNCCKGMSKCDKDHSCCNPPPTEIPEFPTVAIPAVLALGGGYLVMRMKRRK